MSDAVVAACPCGEVYELRPEYAGRLLECPSCGRSFRAGGGRRELRAPTPGADPAFERDVFLLNQRAFAIASKYEVWAEDGTPILFVERPTYPVRTLLAYGLAAIASVIYLLGIGNLAAQRRDELGILLVLVAYATVPVVFLIVSMSMRPLRHVTVYRDESRAEPLLRVLQDQRLALLARTYTLTTAAGERLARFRKSYLDNLVRKRWEIEDAGRRPLATAVEDSMILSLLRRVLGSFFGMLRTNFVLLRADGHALGEFNRKLTLLDRYVLDLSGDPDRALDRRVAIALGVMLDTGERR